MRRELHVRFCEGGGVQLPSATRLVVMCDTKAQVEEARQRVGTVLTRLGLELHPEKTRTVDLSRGRNGFDVLGCHLRKRMSGPIWERSRQRVFYLQRCPSQRARVRVRARVRDLTPRARCHTDLRIIIADLNPVLRGWGQYFRTGNAATRFTDLDQYVERRLRGLLLKRAGSRLAGGRATVWTRPFFEALGLIRLRGTIQYPGVVQATT
jgi:RNA-directed DNA polymerase